MPPLWNGKQTVLLTTIFGATDRFELADPNRRKPNPRWLSARCGKKKNVLAWKKCRTIGLFFMSRRCSSEVGKGRRKIIVIGSIRCIAEKFASPFVIHWSRALFWKFFRFLNLQSTLLPAKPGIRPMCVE